MKCFVSGSRGFIGSHLVEELKKQGHEVIECDLRLASRFDVTPHVNDIRKVTEKDLEGVDWCFHLAAASGSLWFIQPEEGVDINCNGTVHLLEMCRRAKVKKFIMSSTASQYVGMPCPHKEDGPLDYPNFYAATKMFDEHAVKLYNELFGLDAVILRYASVYGDNENSKGELANIVSQFIWKLINGDSPELWYDGKQTRDFIFVDDVVSANIFAANYLHETNADVFNVGTGIETSFVDIVAKINKALGTSVVPTFVQPYSSMQSIQKKRVDRQLMDTTKLAAKGWTAKISIDVGIERILDDLCG